MRTSNQKNELCLLKATHEKFYKIFEFEGKVYCFVNKLAQFNIFILDKKYFSCPSFN